jgi:hypothetical protein
MCSRALRFIFTEPVCAIYAVRSIPRSCAWRNAVLAKLRDLQLAMHACTIAFGSAKRVETFCYRPCMTDGLAFDKPISSIPYWYRNPHRMFGITELLILTAVVNAQCLHIVAWIRLRSIRYSIACTIWDQTNSPLKCGALTNHAKIAEYGIYEIALLRHVRSVPQSVRVDQHIALQNHSL